MSRIPALVSACLVLLVAQASFGAEAASAEPSLDPGGHIGTTMTLHPVADPDAPAVTQQNLMASERFWPYHVELVRSWTPEAGEKPLAAGRRGVLIRVDSPELARIDFAPLYERVRALPDLEPGQLVPQDRVLHRGTGAYHSAKRAVH